MATIKIDTQVVLRERADRVLGINVNYIRDVDGNRVPRARPLAEALGEMGVRFLRYPGGEKSNYHRWSLPPYESPDPQSLGWYSATPGERMDFDAFIALARSLDAEPFVVVGLNLAKHADRSLDEQIADAAAWVRYANTQRGYDVQYWEIGNELWHADKGHDAKEVAEAVVRFAQAMKQVDPTIHVGASGHGEPWWSQFLPTAGPHLDFLTISHYNTWQWGSYDRYLQQPEPDLIHHVRQTIDQARRHMPDGAGEDVQIIVSETNSKDYSDDPWPSDNSLGHALVTFETLGRLLCEPRVTSAMIWNTRWMHDDDAPNNLFYALDAQNQLLPTGRALAMWNAFSPGQMLAVEGETSTLKAFAARAATDSSLTIWLINRSLTETEVAVTWDAGPETTQADHYHFTGTGPDDVNPEWTRLPRQAVDRHAGSRLNLPACSVTVLVIR